MSREPGREVNTSMFLQARSDIIIIINIILIIILITIIFTIIQFQSLGTPLILQSSVASV